jgi:hypothetical protein
MISMDFFRAAISSSLAQTGDTNASALDPQFLSSAAISSSTKSSPPVSAPLPGGVQPVFVGVADPVFLELIQVQREIFNRLMENLKPGVTRCSFNLDHVLIGPAGVFTGGCPRFFRT